LTFRVWDAELTANFQPGLKTVPTPDVECTPLAVDFDDGLEYRRLVFWGVRITNLAKENGHARLLIRVVCLSRGRMATGLVHLLLNAFCAPGFALRVDWKIWLRFAKSTSSMTAGAANLFAGFGLGCRAQPYAWPSPPILVDELDALRRASDETRKSLFISTRLTVGRQFSAFPSQFGPRRSSIPSRLIRKPSLD